MRVGPAILAAQMGSLTQGEMEEGARSQIEKIRRDNISNQDQQTTTRHPRGNRTITNEVEDLIQPTEGDMETVQMGQTLAPPKVVTTIMLTPGKMICTREARDGLQILVLTQRK